MQQRRKSHRGNRKDTLRSLFGGSGYANLQSSLAADPLLSSFVSNLPAVNLSKDKKSEPLNERDADSESLEETILHRYIMR
jgi:Stress-induced protein Di19, C-terminal